MNLSYLCNLPQIPNAGFVKFVLCFFVHFWSISLSQVAKQQTFGNLKIKFRNHAPLWNFPERNGINEIYRYGCASWYLQRPPTRDNPPCLARWHRFLPRDVDDPGASRVGWSVISHPFQHPVIPPTVNGVLKAYVAILQITSLQKVLLMDEILHQLIGRISNSLRMDSRWWSPRESLQPMGGDTWWVRIPLSVRIPRIGSATQHKPPTTLNRCKIKFIYQPKELPKNALKRTINTFKMFQHTLLFEVIRWPVNYP